MTCDNKKKLKKVLTSSAKCAIIFPVSERKTTEKFIPREFTPVNRPFVPREEPVSKAFVPRKKSEKKVEKGVDFVPKVC